jgi:uncharacterized protein YgiM (DUF1202 family)
MRSDRFLSLQTRGTVWTAGSRLFYLALLGGLITIWPSLAWASSLFAKQDGINVTADKVPTSAVVATLKLGEEVTVLSEEGRLVNVKTAAGKTGWVFKFRLTEEKPSTGGGLGLSGLTGQTTIAAREARAGGSIRGLKESTEQYAKTKDIQQEHRDAVDRMTAYSISAEELMQFKKTGNLGEFLGGAQ